MPLEHHLGITVSAKREERAGFSPQRGLSEAVSETPGHGGPQGPACAAQLLQLQTGLQRTELPSRRSLGGQASLLAP